MALGSAFFSLLSTSVSRSVLDCVRNVVDYYNELRVSNHPLTIFLGSPFLSHTYVNEDAILFLKKQQEQNYTSHAMITTRIHGSC